ncbi:MAG: hypothetical protein AAF797_02815 [Planctomycetota bacterium]
MSPRREIPPYEIMRRSKPTDSREAVRPRGGRRGFQRRAEASGEGWLGVLTAPLELSVPRWAAAVVVLVVLILVLGAYRLGAGSGAEEATERFEAERQEQQAVVVEQARQSEDPRRAGLNYLRLPPMPEGEARRLQAFFGERGVETFAEKLDTSRFLVWLTEHGLTAEEIRQGELPDRIRNQMRAIGVLWREHNGGGDNLGSMYWDKHEGSPRN